MKLSRRATGIGGALVLTLALALAACGEDDTIATPADTPTDSSVPASPSATTAPEPETSSTPSGSASVSEVHNAADVAFAQGMIVHHRGAIDMAELAVGRAESPEVVALAERISGAQGPEIETMSSWLETWGEEVPEGMSMGGMDHGGMEMGPMPGMMSEEQMAQLEAASGTEFDRMFLEMMTVHHQGAVTMAQTEQAEGENPQALELAANIEADQTAEIEEMQQLLQSR